MYYLNERVLFKMLLSLSRYWGNVFHAKNIAQHLGNKLVLKIFCGPDHQSQSRDWIWSCESVVPVRRLRSAYGMLLSTYLHLFKHSPLSADSSRPGSVSASLAGTQNTNNESVTLTSRASVCKQLVALLHTSSHPRTANHRQTERNMQHGIAIHNKAQHNDKCRNQN